MRAALALLRESSRARRFFAAYAQSTVGSGVTLVALPLLALQRYDSATAVAAVLLAELVPVMLLGATLGAAADRWPPRTCAIVADVLRASALAAIVLVDPLWATVALAALAGLGTGLFYPAALTWMPALAGPRHATAATALFTAISSAGRTVGALTAALLFALLGAEGAITTDAVSFALSAIVLATLPARLAAAGADEHEQPPEAAPAEDSTAARVWHSATLRGVVVSAGAVALAAGIVNVAEPQFVTRTLDAPASGFALVVASWSIGFAAGSLTGAEPTLAVAVLRRRYLLGIVAMAVGLAGAGSADGLALALAGFAVNGLGNGMLVIYERRLIDVLVTEGARGRAFGTVDAVASWAYAGSLVAAGFLVAGAGARATILVAAAATAAVALLVAGTALAARSTADATAA